MIASALIVGTGLLGTSTGLALKRAGVQVLFTDLDERGARLGADLAGGSLWQGEAVDVVVVAVPTDAIAKVVFDHIAQNLSRTIIDLGSVKSQPVLEVQRLLAESGHSIERFCPSHPMAGRERAGAEAARGDLFEGRPWILAPAEGTGSQAVADAEAVARLVGAVPVQMNPADHDAAMAWISHLPQILSSAMAGSLLGVEESAVALAGNGLRDLTRIAGSDPGLWTGILRGNAKELYHVLDQVINRLRVLQQSLNSKDDKAVYQWIADGNAGRLRLPGKHGGASSRYVVIPVVVDDRPGQLAALFAAAGESHVNIEDLAMEHSPGQEAGLVELSVLPGDADRFIAFLTQAGWRVHPPRTTVDLTAE